MKNSPRISFRLPPKLLTALDSRAKTRGVTPSRYIVEVLIDHCGIEVAPLEYTFSRSPKLAKKAAKSRKLPPA